MQTDLAPPRPSRLSRRSGLLAAALLVPACASPREDAGGPLSVVLAATRGDERVAVLDARSLEELRSFPIGLGAHELAANSTGSLAIGSAYGGPGAGHQPADNRLAVFDPRSGELLRTIDLGEHVRPNDVVFLRDDRRALVTSEVRGALLLVDAVEGRIDAVWELGERAGHMLCYAPDAPSPSGAGRAFVSHVFPGAVTVLDAGTGERLGRVETAVGAEGIATTRDGSRVWCANNRSGSVTVFDGRTLELVATFEQEGFPFRVEVSPDDRTVAITCPESNDVRLFDAATCERRGRLDLAPFGSGASPEGVAFDAGGDAIVVACPQAALLVAFDLASGGVVATAPAGSILDPIASARLVAGS
ncbi:MAG: hypothetical protein R3F34_12520 [Planctomycetota bacterium]